MDPLIIVAIAATVLTATGAAYEAHQMGQQVKAADARKARVEAEQATQKQIDMRRNMLRALASQNASSLGAVGVGGTGSFGANVKRQITENQNDLLVSRANASAQISLLDQAGSNAATQGNVQGVIDLTQGAAQAAGLGVQPKH